MEKDYIHPDWVDIFTFKTIQEELEHEARMFDARILSEVERICDERGITRTALSAKSGIKRNALTRMLRGDIPLKSMTIARLQHALDIKFNITVKDKPEKLFFNNEQK